MTGQLIYITNVAREIFQTTASGGNGAAGHNAEHAAEQGFNIGEHLLHHMTDLGSVEAFFKVFSLEPLQFHLFGIDMSITKPVLYMWLAGVILLLSFGLSFRGGRLMRTKFAQLLEVYVLYIRDEVVYPIMGEKDGRRMMPFFLNTFFFILTCNLLGLVPWGYTATSNVNVTGGLAIVAFIVIQGMGIVENGLVNHLKAIVPPGIPAPVMLIMIPIEIIGMFAKPFALCIRLFANMVAGHAVILVLLLLVIQAGSYLVAPAPIFAVLFISCLELFVAHLQAFIFTILTVLFTSMTMHPAH